MSGETLKLKLWDIRQDSAQRSYRCEWAPLMRDVLWDARHGLLSHDWRSTISTRRRHKSSADEGLPDLPEWLTDARTLAVSAIANMDIRPWEPGAGTDWRAALDGWYADMMRLDDADMDTALEAQRKSPLTESSVLSFWNLSVERHRRGQDHHGAMYYAGLSGQGVDVDWRQWYRDRMSTWTVELDASLCFDSVPAQMERLDDGGFDYFESLPPYWLATTE